MIYLLDGYNLLFSLVDSKQSLAEQRTQLIQFLQKQFSSLSLSGLLVFDGAHRRGEESGLSYHSPLEIAYAPKGQNADSYIIERIELERNPKEVTVVTNDRGLILHARSKGAHVLSNRAFIHYLTKQKKKRTSGKKREISESPQNIDRLLKIFEERLNQIDDFE